MIKKEVYLGLIAFILFEKYLTIPFLFNKNLVALVILVFGLIFLYTTIIERGTHKKVIATITALLMIFLGIFPLLINLRLLTSLPFLPLLRIPLYSFSIILMGFGLYKLYEFFAIK